MKTSSNQIWLTSNTRDGRANGFLVTFGAALQRPLASVKFGAPGWLHCRQGALRLARRIANDPAYATRSMECVCLSRCRGDYPAWLYTTWCRPLDEPRADAVLCAPRCPAADLRRKDRYDWRRRRWCRLTAAAVRAVLRQWAQPARLAA